MRAQIRVRFLAGLIGCGINVTGWRILATFETNPSAAEALISASDINIVLNSVQINLYMARPFWMRLNHKFFSATELGDA